MFPRVVSILCCKLLCLIALFMLAGCFDSELEQRKACIDLIQTNILDQKSPRFILLTSAQKKELGPYIQQYEFLMKAASFEDIHEQDKLAAIEGLYDSLEKTDDPKKRSEILDQIEKQQQAERAQIARVISDLHEKKDMLTQPDDLKAVFDEAFERCVVSYVAIYVDMSLKVYDAMADVLQANRELNSLAIANPGKINIIDGQFVVIHKSIAPQLDTLLKKRKEALGQLHTVIKEASTSF